MTDVFDELRHESAREQVHADGMKTVLIRPVMLVTGLVLLIAAAISGFWLSSLPSRSLSALKLDLKSIGLELKAGSAELTGNGGVGAAFNDVVITSSDSGFSARIARIDVAGTWPWSTPSITLERPDIAYALGGLGASPLVGQQNQAALGFALQASTISDGSVKISDAAGRDVLNIVQISGDMISRDSELMFRGKAAINGVRTQFRVESSEAGRLFDDGAPTDVFVASLSEAAPFDVQYSGRLRLSQGFALDGRFSSAASDAQVFFALVGLPQGLPVTGPLAAEGGVSLSSTGVDLRDLTLSQGPAEAKGRVNIRFGKDVHGVEGVLHMPMLALPLLDVSSAWTEAAFALPDFSGLAGGFEFHAQSSRLGRFQAGPTTLSAGFAGDGPSLKLIAKSGDGNLETAIKQGVGKEADVFTLSARWTALDAEPAIQALTGKRGVSGRTDGVLDLKATGRNWAEAVSSAEGSYALELKQGAIDGFSIKSALSTAGKGWRSNVGDKTESLDVSLAGLIQDGIAVIDLKSLKADGKTYAVKGEVDLLRHALALDVTPAGAKRLGIFGSWSVPDIGPDVVGAPKPPPAPDQAAANPN